MEDLDEFLRDGESLVCIPCARPEFRFYQPLTHAPQADSNPHRASGTPSSTGNS